MFFPLTLYFFLQRLAERLGVRRLSVGLFVFREAGDQIFELAPAVVRAPELHVVGPGGVGNDVPVNDVPGKGGRPAVVQRVRQALRSN